jgi:uncharacterized protein (DUF433 family)
MQKKAGQQRELGKYIVADPRICHGEPVFKETRKLVRDCIEMAANGLTIDELASRANLPREAIVEALHFAAEVLQRHYTDRPAVASRARERLSACA